MTIEELRNALRHSSEAVRTTSFGSVDVEADHARQDELLLEYINDPEVTKIFEDSEKWYA